MSNLAHENAFNQQFASLQAQAKNVGIVLVILSLLSIFAMLHHPSVSAVDIQEQIAELQHEASVNEFVHGVLIAITLLISVCLTVYAKLRSTYRPLIMVGMMSFWLGSLAMLVAALMSGFVVPDLGQMYSGKSSSELDVFKGLWGMSWQINQAFAEFGTVSWCAAMFFWAFDMLKQSARIKVFGAISLVTSVVIAGSLAMGLVKLNVAGMTAILVAVCVWQIGIAAILITKCY